MHVLLGKYFVDNKQCHACLQFSVRSQFDTDNYCYHWSWGHEISI